MKYSESDMRDILKRLRSAMRDWAKASEGSIAESRAAGRMSAGIEDLLELVSYEIDFIEECAKAAWDNRMVPGFRTFDSLDSEEVEEQKSDVLAALRKYRELGCPELPEDES
jgi:hypothetical protein